MLLKGVPDKYAMERLGQSTPNLIKNVYQHIFQEEQNKISQTLNLAFENIFNEHNIDNNTSTQNNQNQKNDNQENDTNISNE